MKSKIIQTALLGLGLLASCFANAGVIFSSTGNQVTMQVINESYTLTSSQSQNILYVAFLDVFFPGGNSVSNSSTVSGFATYSRNGGPQLALSWWQGWQFRPGFQSPWTPEDVAFLFNLPVNTLSIGDIITINGTLTMNSSNNPNVKVPDITTGSVSTVIGGHSVLYSGVRSTNLGPMPTVPAPSTFILFVLSILVLVTCRSDKKLIPSLISAEF